MKSFKQYLIEMSKAEAQTVLGLSGAYTVDDVKIAYKKASIKHHPDKGGDVETMKKVNVAYDLLKNSTGSVSGNVDRDEIDKIYKDLQTQVIDDLKPKFKPKEFQDYFEKYFNQPFQMTVDWSTLSKRTVYYSGFKSKFFNADKTIVFDFSVSVYLSNLRKTGSSSLSTNPDLGYDMTIEASGYAGKKKQKMSKRDWGFKNDHSVLSTPEKLFPVAKMKKIVSELAADTGEHKSMTRAGFFKALTNEVGISEWNASDNSYSIPLKDGIILIRRSVFMRVAAWSFLNIGNREGYRLKTDYYTRLTLPEDTKTLEIMIKLKSMNKSEANDYLKTLK